MLSTSGHGPRRAILYARASIYEQARSRYSLAQQPDAPGTCAAREGYEILEEVSPMGEWFWRSRITSPPRNVIASTKCFG